ncbi:MAG: hypothetical protein ABI851_15775 [Saprospiraceae bacterium]
MKTTQQSYEKRALIKETFGLNVYKLRGKTFLRRMPGRKPAKAAKQPRSISCLKKADQFAKSVVADPVQKELYETKAAGQCSAYNKAVSEYMLTH